MVRIYNGVLLSHKKEQNNAICSNIDGPRGTPLMAQLVKNLPAVQETPVQICWRRDRLPTPVFSGFPCSSAGKESTCNAGDSGSIPGLGRSAGEGTGYPLQYSWVFLVVQLVKNPPAMQETWVRSLGWEDPLEEGTATHSNILAWRIPWTVYSPWGQNVLNK